MSSVKTQHLGIDNIILKAFENGEVTQRVAESECRTV